MQLPLVRVVKHNIPYIAFCTWTAVSAALKLTAPVGLPGAAVLQPLLSGCLWHQLLLLSLDAVANLRAGRFHKWWQNGRYGAPPAPLHSLLQPLAQLELDAIATGVQRSC